MGTVREPFATPFKLDPPGGRRRRGNALWAGIFALLAFGCLAFGGVETWAVTILQLSAAGLLAWWVGLQLKQGSVELLPSPLYFPLALFALVIAAQLIFRRSAYSYSTWTEALGYCGLLALFFLSSQCLRDEDSLRKFATALAIFGFLVAVFAVIQDVAGNGKLYWLRQPRYGGNIFGPYVNKNHFAGLMEMLAPVPLVMCMTRFMRSEFRVLAGFAGVFMAATVFLSKSRGGMVAVLVQMIFLAVCLQKRERSRSSWMAFTAIALLMIGFVVWLGASDLLDRINTLRDPLNDQTAGFRLQVVKDSLRMFADRPLLGWGLGTFPVAYPHYRTFFTDLFVNQAHNDYVQALVETGLLGGIAVIWFLVTFYRSGWRLLDTWNADPRRALCFAAMIGCTGLLVHSLSDFNFHIPANAAVFFVLAAVVPSARQQQSRTLSFRPGGVTRKAKP